MSIIVERYHQREKSNGMGQKGNLGPQNRREAAPLISRVSNMWRLEHEFGEKRKVAERSEEISSWTRLAHSISQSYQIEWIEVVMVYCF